MDNAKNALAELAKRLEAVLPYVAVECGVCEIDKHLTSKRAKDFIVASQRIVAELASVETDRRGTPWEDTLVTAFEQCREIAEEGGKE